MSALNIRDIGAERKRALDSLSSASGIPVAELVRCAPRVMIMNFG